MRKIIWAGLAIVPLLATGLVYASSLVATSKPQIEKADGYTCPITGEELPYPNCCPLNEK
jgi:hypothetical protein